MQVNPLEQGWLLLLGIPYIWFHILEANVEVSSKAIENFRAIFQPCSFR